MHPRLEFRRTFIALTVSALAWVAPASPVHAQPTYYQVVSILEDPQQATLKQDWIASQFLSAEQQAVVSAIEFFQLGELDDALEVLANYQATSSLPELFFWAGRIYGRQAAEASVFSAKGLAEDALENFLRAVELDANFVEGHQALIQYYLQAPFFAGGSIEKADAQALKLLALDTLKGQFAQLEIAQREERETQIPRLQTAIANTLAQKYAAFDFDGVDNGYYQLALLAMQQEQWDQGREWLKNGLDANRDAQAQLENSGVIQRVAAYRSKVTEQSILYQLGRIGVLSEANIDDSIMAFQRFLTGPEHPSYNRYWAQLRLAQLKVLIGDKASAQTLYDGLPDVDDDNFEKAKKQLRKKLK